jgi:ATP adenylyltransferase
MQEEQSDVIMEISALLKPNGKAYFAVRRDITYEGFRTHKIHQKPTYQCNVKLPFPSIFLNDSCEIYVYQHYTTIHMGKDKC